MRTIFAVTILIGMFFFHAAWICESRGEILPESRPKVTIPKDRIRNVREMYAHVRPDILGLKGPVTVKETGVFFDGGTLYFALEDCRGKALLGSIFPVGSSERDVPKYLDSHVTLGSKHWSEPSARTVAIRGPEETALYAIFIRATREYEDARKKAEKDRPEWTTFFPDVIGAFDLRYCYESEEWRPKKGDDAKQAKTEEP